MNYSELSTAIQDYCQNSETTFVNHINDFIIAAEDKIFMAVSMPAFWKSDSTNVTTSGRAEYQVAPGVVDIFSARVGETAVVLASATSGPEVVEDGPVRYLLRKDYDFLLEAYPGTTSGVTSGIPKYYAVSSASPGKVVFTSTGAGNETTSGSTTVSFGAIGYGLVKPYWDANPAIEVVGPGIPAGTTIDSFDVSPNVTISNPATATSSTPTAIRFDFVSSLGSGVDPVMTIRLGPIPDAVYPMTVDYYGKTSTDSITSGSTPGAPLTTNTWLSVTAPDTLLYGALSQAYTFMKGEPDIIQNYELKFNEGLMLLKNMGEGRQASDAFVSGPPTMQAR